MEAVMLTSQQMSFFRTFGYLRLPGLLADRIGEIVEEFEATFAEHGGGHAGHAHDGKARSCIAQFIDHRPKLASLIDDPRILGIMKSIAGDDFNYMGSDGIYYVGDTGWHSDGWSQQRVHAKIAFYLDHVAATTGALRVIPGSHLIGDRYATTVNELIFNSAESLGAPGSEIPAIALESTPGDVVCFNHNLKHAAYGGNSRRRMFTINFSQRYADADLQELRDYMAGGARFWIEEAYGKAMVEFAGPERMRHLEQAIANEGHLAELSRKARETMAEPARG